MTKYIRLYEEYTDIKKKGLPKNISWTDVRDQMNLKLPFMIIDFEDEDSRTECIQDDLQQEDYVEQSYHVKRDADLREIPSVFVFCDDSDLIDRIGSLQKRFKIERIIFGKYGKRIPTLYIDGESVDFSQDIKTGIGPDDVDNDEYYKIGSSYYKFIK